MGAEDALHYVSKYQDTKQALEHTQDSMAQQKAGYEQRLAEQAANAQALQHHYETQLTQERQTHDQHQRATEQWFLKKAQLDQHYLFQAAQEKAQDTMRRAWQQGTEHKDQPVDTLLGADRSLAIVQNAPRRITTFADGSLGLTPVHTTITVIQQPTPLPTLVPQDSRIQTTVNGVDNIETKAILPERLGVDQLEAIKKIADNGTLIAQQRFAVEQYRINSEAQLEWLRISKSFVLWGFLFSIPFLLTLHWIGRNILAGWRDWQNARMEYKLKEWETSERIVRESHK